MTNKRFEYKNHKVYDNLTGETHSSNMVSVNVLNELAEENVWLKKENNKLHQKIFEMRTNIALERTEISRQSYTSKEFLDEIEKW